jgi:hypothetical protein
MGRADINQIAGSGDSKHAPDQGGHAPGHAGRADRFRVSTDISDLASLLSRLQQLKQTDPAKVSQVLACAADIIRSDEASQKVSGASRLAERFEQAAQAGDLSPLQPTASVAEPRDHNRVHGVQSYGAQASPPDLADIVRRAMERAGVA